MPAQNPGDPSGMSAYGRWMYGPWFWPPASPPYGPIDNPYYDPNCDLNDSTTWHVRDRPVLRAAADPGHAQHLHRHGAVQRHADRQWDRLSHDHGGAQGVPPAHPERSQRPLLQPPLVRGRSDHRQHRPQRTGNHWRAHRRHRGRAQPSRAGGSPDRPEHLPDARHQSQPARAELDRDRHRGRFPAGAGGRARPADHLDHRPHRVQRRQRGSSTRCWWRPPSGPT